MLVTEAEAQKIAADVRRVVAEALQEAEAESRRIDQWSLERVNKNQESR